MEFGFPVRVYTVEGMVVRFVRIYMRKTEEYALYGVQNLLFLNGLML